MSLPLVRRTSAFKEAETALLVSAAAASDFCIETNRRVTSIPRKAMRKEKREEQEKGREENGTLRAV